MLGLADTFVEHGEQQALLTEQGLDALGIERSVRARFGDLLALRAAGE
jgi:1-deoxy-D-xylulose-5-phosphate synthase